MVFGDVQNLVKTARILAQTQPSASRQIEQFQTFFKEPLFQQIQRQKKLTTYGIEVHKYYKDSVYNLRNLRDTFAGQSILERKERLTLAARSEILQKHISPLKFKGGMELLALTGDEIREKMKLQTLDIAVLQENFESYDYFRKKLFISSWKLVIPKSWLAQSPSPQKWFELCKEYAFAAYEPSLVYLESNRQRSFKLPQLRVDFTANDWRLLADKVQQQACWSIVPEEFAKSELNFNIGLQTLMKETQFYIYFKRDLVKNRDVQYLVDQLS